MEHFLWEYQVDVSEIKDRWQKRENEDQKMLLLQQRFSLITTRVLYKLIQNGGTEPEAMSFQVHPYAPIVIYCVGTVTRLQLVRYTALSFSRREKCLWWDSLCQGKAEGTRVLPFIKDSSWRVYFPLKYFQSIQFYFRHLWFWGGNEISAFSKDQTHFLKLSFNWNPILSLKKVLMEKFSCRFFWVF